MLIIRDIRFETIPGECAINAVLDGASSMVRWSINIACQPRTVDGLEWQPSLSHESLAFQVRDWRTLAGLNGVFPPAPDGSSSLYVFEYGDIGPSSLLLSNRRGATFALEWRCLANLFCGEPYDADVPILTRCDVHFRGVTVSHPAYQTAESASARLGEEFDLSTLMPPESIERAGVPLISFLFPPRA